MSAIAELGAFLLDVPENDEGWLVYADWLIKQDDERDRHTALNLQLQKLGPALSWGSCRSRTSATPATA